MADEFDKAYVEGILKGARDDINEAVKTFRESIKGLPYGVKRPTDEDVMATWAKWTGMYPVQPCVLPNGMMVMESPWVLTVMGAENGREWLSRYRTMVKRQPVEEGI